MKKFILLFSALALQIGCSHSQTQSSKNDMAAAANNLMASAHMESKSKSKAQGHVNFTQSEEGVLVEYNFEGLAKNKKFGFHIHEKGDCSSDDAKSAGPHYMMLAETGGTSVDNPHQYAGDLPMVKSDNKGKAEGRFVVTSISLDGANPVRGRAIILHGGPDNLKKKSPPRIACGVIR